MKKLMISFLLTMFVLMVSAQKQGAFRVGFDGGVAIPRGGAGIMAAFEPKYNLTDNLNIGLRFGLAAMAKEIDFTVGSEPTQADAGVNAGSLLTMDYYFNKGGRSAFYLGAGAGYFALANVRVDDDSNVDELTEIGVSGKPGALVRLGFESGKFRMGAEYNLIPETDLQNTAGNIIGSSRNSYLAIHLGFYIGGGKWGK